jgi:uncharacterized repeat protein (TIGR03803 family)
MGAARSEKPTSRNEALKEIYMEWTEVFALPKLRTVFMAVAIAGLAPVFLNIAASAQTETALYKYPNTSSNDTGIVWPGILIQGVDGELYGTIQTNGANSQGTVFKMTTDGDYTQVYNFCAEGGGCLVTGAIPDGGVTLGSDGNYYGTTQNGGAFAFGSVYKLTPTGTLTNLWSFTEDHTTQHINDAGFPSYAPLLGQDGNFYGVASGDYTGDYGDFYKVTAKGAFTPHNFNFTDGDGPNLPVQGSDGSFYGTTQFGGDPTCKCGVVYKTTTAGKITVLHNFTGGASDGNRPTGILVQGKDGDFYGTTYSGGSNGLGTIFKISSTKVYKLIHSFTGDPDGTHPLAGMIAGSDGNLYGTTTTGGSHNGGSVYKLTTAGALSIVYNFCAKSGCVDGFNLNTPLIQHTNGKFYGNTSGNSLGGSVFYSLDTGLDPFVKLVEGKGKVAAKVGILGQGFTSATSVKFNGAAAAFTKVSDTYIVATVPAAAKSGSVSVTTSEGILESSNTFLVTPAIKTIAPASGPVGTSVMITGTGFTGATKVTVGGVSATFTVNSASQITAKVPVGAKTGKIVVTTPGGTATSTSTFTLT